MVDVKRSSSMRQVAQAANMSIATVSRALRDPESVSKRALARVEEAAAAVGYTYNATAGDVLAGRSTVLGVIVPSVASTLFGPTLHALQDTAMEAQFSVMHAVTNWELGREERLLETMIKRRVHGLVMTGLSERAQDRVCDVVNEAGIRTVVIWEKPVDNGLSYVGIDNFEAARKATAFLIEQGHRRIGFIGGPGSVTPRSQHRCQGYGQALEDHDIAYDADIVLQRFPELANGREAMHHIMSVDDAPTAVFVASDILAIGALRAAHELKLSVPEDVSILGFDNLEITAFQQPPITTMNMPSSQIGTLAAQIALEEHGAPPRHYCLDSELVLRESVGRPRR